MKTRDLSRGNDIQSRIRRGQLDGCSEGDQLLSTSGFAGPWSGGEHESLFAACGIFSFQKSLPKDMKTAFEKRDDRASLEFFFSHFFAILFLVRVLEGYKDPSLFSNSQ